MHRNTAIRLLQALLLGSSAYVLPLMALPEDAQQPFESESASSDLLLDEGLVIYRGTAEVPAKVQQGSLLITGIEIRIQRQNDVLQSVTATGNPARFQQQPARDQELVHASGNQIKLDNLAHVLAIDVAAELILGGNTVRANHIDYNIETRRGNATGIMGGEPARTIIPATPAPP